MGDVAERLCLTRVIRVTLLALAALMVFIPAKVSAAAANRIVAVGDLHGDYQAWITIARAAGLIDAGGHWAGGGTTLVQLGDILDREPDSLKIVRSLQQLQKEAPRSHGRVIVVLGNHEAMNLLGDFRYTTPGEFAAFSGPNSAAIRDRVYDQNRALIEKAAQAANPALTPDQIRQSWMAEHPLGWIEHKIAWSSSGELGKWASRNAAVVKIDGTLFVHGGLSAEYSKLPLDEINRRVQTAMSNADGGPSTILYDPLGPLWYRGLVGRDPDAEEVRAKAAPVMHLTIDQELDAVLTAYGAKRLVIGHTPDLNGIEISNGGRLARIDTGISRAYGGPLTWLEIISGTMVPHVVGRPAQ
jgi:calcineurin-like phosphoesterase family protein